MKKPSFKPKPRVNAKNLDLNALTWLTWKAIVQVNDPPALFVRENALVRTPVVSSQGGVVCQELDQKRLRYELAARINFFKRDKYGESAARPPEDLLKNIFSTPDPPLPILLGVVRHPVFAPDGSLQNRAGYSAATPLIYSPPVGFELPMRNQLPEDSFSNKDACEEGCARFS